MTEATLENEATSLADLPKDKQPVLFRKKRAPQVVSPAKESKEGLNNEREVYFAFDVHSGDVADLKTLDFTLNKALADTEGKVTVLEENVGMTEEGADRFQHYASELGSYADAYAALSEKIPLNTNPAEMRANVEEARERLKEDPRKNFSLRKYEMYDDANEDGRIQVDFEKGNQDEVRTEVRSLKEARGLFEKARKLFDERDFDQGLQAAKEHNESRAAASRRRGENIKRIAKQNFNEGSDAVVVWMGDGHRDMVSTLQEPGTNVHAYSGLGSETRPSRQVYSKLVKGEPVSDDEHLLAYMDTSMSRLHQRAQRRQKRREHDYAGRAHAFNELLKREGIDSLVKSTKEKGLSEATVAYYPQYRKDITSFEDERENTIQEIPETDTSKKILPPLNKPPVRDKTPEQKADEAAAAKREMEELGRRAVAAKKMREKVEKSDQRRKKLGRIVGAPVAAARRVTEGIQTQQRNAPQTSAQEPQYVGRSLYQPSEAKPLPPQPEARPNEGYTSEQKKALEKRAADLGLPLDTTNYDNLARSIAEAIAQKAAVAQVEVSSAPAIETTSDASGVYSPETVGSTAVAEDIPSGPSGVGPAAEAPTAPQEAPAPQQASESTFPTVAAPVEAPKTVPLQTQEDVPAGVPDYDPDTFGTMPEQPASTYVPKPPETKTAEPPQPEVQDDFQEIAKQAYRNAEAAGDRAEEVANLAHQAVVEGKSLSRKDQALVRAVAQMDAPEERNVGN